MCVNNTEGMFLYLIGSTNILTRPSFSVWKVRQIIALS